MISYLKQNALIKKRLKVLEIAPTKTFQTFFEYRWDCDYLGIDIDPDPLLAKGIKTRFFDLCKMDPASLGQFDIIINSHVMEHIRCGYIPVIEALSGLLRPGGVHLISVLFGGDKTNEDMDPTLSGDERLRRFGHPDHVRFFGHKDFPEELRSRFRGVFQEVSFEDVPSDQRMKLSLGKPLENRLFVICNKQQ